MRPYGTHWKRFPRLPAGWQTKVTIHVYDGDLPPKRRAQAVRKALKYLRYAGKFIGVGTFKRGWTGMQAGTFAVTDVQVRSR